MADVTVTVLVPTEEGRQALADLAGVTALRYEPGQVLDERQREAEVLVPAFLSSDRSRHLELLEQLPNLRLIQLLTAGAELWTRYTPEGVALATCRGAHGGATAEWVLAALLAMYRELEPFAIDRGNRRWDQHSTETLLDKRVLVVGAGDLGHQLRRRFEASDAHTTLVGNTAREGVHGVDELPELLPEHDVTVLVVPLTSATRGMVDAKFLAAMPDGAVLVNAARGPVVDTDALLAELTTRRLRAALDVTDPEPLPPEHPLWSAPNLLLTPHVGGSVTGSGARSWRIAAAEIARFAAGERPRNLVTGEY